MNFLQVSTYIPTIYTVYSDLFIELFIYLECRKWENVFHLLVNCTNGYNVQFLGLSQAKPRSLGHHPGLSCEWQKPKHSSLLALSYWAHSQKLNLKQSGTHRSVSLTCCAT